MTKEFNTQQEKLLVQALIYRLGDAILGGQEVTEDNYREYTVKDYDDNQINKYELETIYSTLEILLDDHIPEFEYDLDDTAHQCELCGRKNNKTREGTVIGIGYRDNVRDIFITHIEICGKCLRSLTNTEEHIDKGLKEKFRAQGMEITRLRNELKENEERLEKITSIVNKEK